MRPQELLPSPAFTLSGVSCTDSFITQSFVGLSLLLHFSRGAVSSATSGAAARPGAPVPTRGGCLYYGGLKEEMLSGG